MYVSLCVYVLYVCARTRVCVGGETNLCQRKLRLIYMYLREETCIFFPENNLINMQNKTIYVSGNYAFVSMVWLQLLI